MKLRDLEILHIKDDPKFPGVEAYCVLLPGNKAMMFEKLVTAHAFRQGWRAALGMTMDLPTKELGNSVKRDFNSTQ